MDLSTTKNKIIAIAILIMTFGLGWYATPTKTVTKVETQEVIREVVKVVKDVVKEKQTDKDIKIIEETKPDGSKTKTTYIIDKSKTTTEITESMQKQIDEYRKQVSEKTVEKDTGRTYLGLMAGTSVDNLLKKDLGLQAHYRLIGPLTLGGYGLIESKQIGVTVGVTF